MAIKGLKEIQERGEELSSFNNENKPRYLYLKDGDVALIRFIDDENMIQTKVHEYEEMTPEGKRYRQTYCVHDLDGSPCKWCAAGNIPKNLYVFVTYVYNILHKTQNPLLSTNPNAVSWTPVQQGKQFLYQEDVNAIRVLKLKFGQAAVNRTKVQNLINEYNTLTDRDYKFSRTGSSLKTSYDLIPKDSSPTPDEVLEAAKTAVKIDDVVVPKKAVVTEKPKQTLDGESAFDDEDINSIF